MSRIALSEVPEGEFTLGMYIDLLKRKDPTHVCPQSFGPPRSWRGAYAELAIAPDDAPRTISQMLEEAEAAVRAVMTGYKGGEYIMSLDTPLHIDEWGHYTDGDAAKLILSDLGVDTEGLDLKEDCPLATWLAVKTVLATAASPGQAPLKVGSGMTVTFDEFPRQYRIGLSSKGLVLQGEFAWKRSDGHTGAEWRTIPVVKLEE